MGGQNNLIQEFLDNVSDAKLENLPAKETCLSNCDVLGFRLDHQGLNNDLKQFPFIHRLYIQPIGKSKTGTRSRRVQAFQSTKAVCAQCHASEDATPDKIRAALMASALVSAKQIGYAPPREAQQTKVKPS